MLTHFTKTIEALDSIVNKGFLYLHNETGVLGPITRDAFGICADGQSDGMICFTELSPDETHNHQSTFGKFGVGVSKEWLVQQNAKKVTYVTIAGEHYEFLLAMMKSLAPKTLYGVPTERYLNNPETRFVGSLALSSIEWAKNAGASSEYVAFLEFFEWSQIDGHAAQKEWRVRNPKPYNFSGAPEREQRIRLLLNCISDPNVPDYFEGLMKYTIDGSTHLACSGKLSLVLHLPIEQIRAIFCPKRHEPEIQGALNEAGLSNIPIIASTTTD